MDGPRRRQIVDAHDRKAGFGRPREKFRDICVLIHILIRFGLHRAAPVPTASSYDVYSFGHERVGATHHRTYIGVATPVFDRDVEGMAAAVEILFDCFRTPVAVLVHDVSAIAGLE